MFLFVYLFIFCLHAYGDLVKDGLALNNGFFHSRHFVLGSEADCLEFFDQDSGDEEDGMTVMEDTSTQDIAKMHRDTLERQEFIRKCRVRGAQLDLLAGLVG